MEETARREKWYYIVSDREDSPVGLASLKVEDSCRALLGFVVFRGHRGKGFALEIIRALVDWPLAQPWIHRVYALCDTENIASARVMQKAGKRREAVWRRCAVHPNMGGEPRDVVCYALNKEVANHSDKVLPRSATP